MAQWVKDLALSLLWLGLLLLPDFNSWPRNFCMGQAGMAKKQNETHTHTTKRQVKNKRLKLEQWNRSQIPSMHMKKFSELDSLELEF